jgi:gamma-glutamylputrescine oxidase
VSRLASPNDPLWNDHSWPGLPGLDRTLEADVCVVGLGGSGLTCVLECLALGARVVGVEARTVAGGAAGRNGGFLLAGTADFHHDAVTALGRQRAAALYRLTLDEMARIAADVPEAVRFTGSLRIADSAEELDDCRRQLAAMLDDGLLAQWYQGPEGEGLLVPTDGTFHPVHRARTLARRALERGARLYEETRAEEIAPGDVRTTLGRVRARHVIVAVDGGLETIFPALGDRVRSARLQMLGTAPAPEVTVPRPVYVRYGYDYWQQLGDGRVVLGGGRDRAETSEWTLDAEPTDAVQDYLDGVLRERVGVWAPVTHRWAASVSFTTDGVPVMAEVMPEVWAIGAYSGTGNVIGALCARAVARLALKGDRVLAAPFLS